MDLQVGEGVHALGGHVKELSGMLVHEEFRDGNASPGAGDLVRDRCRPECGGAGGDFLA